jgi:hypothetical protein
MDRKRLDTEMTGLIAAAVTSAGIKETARTSSGAPQPLGKTAYQEMATQVMLRDVTLSQLVSMMHTLAGGEAGLQIKSLQLSAPRDSVTGDRWMADMVVTYLIYVPETEK